jgi:hypothetical protein
MSAQVQLTLDAKRIPVSKMGGGGYIAFDVWACQRPLTSHWGSGQVFERAEARFGRFDVIFGHTDGPVGAAMVVDKNTGYEWARLPFGESQFEFGYWDPPYFTLDSVGTATLKPCLYRKEGREIWRVVRRLAILHTHIWPRAWLQGAEREGMIAITMGPMKQIRCLQVFRKSTR